MRPFFKCGSRVRVGGVKGWGSDVDKRWGVLQYLGYRFGLAKWLFFKFKSYTYSLANPANESRPRKTARPAPRPG
ncbi:hypothetical protein HanIR_Chr15g0742711 [Helianthus annuus]|nr:hypothetical protein HanIR_Chr15g0742711 [Helianthus annuus]